MNLTIHIENTDDYPFIRHLLERIEGVSIVDNAEEIIEGLPRSIYEALDNYGANLKEEDLISEEEFFKTIRNRTCELYSPK